jgi:hypothetical protein
VRYQVFEAAFLVGLYPTEAEALAAVRSRCEVDDLPLWEAVQARVMTVRELDRRGRVKRQWQGAALSERMSNDPGPGG